MEVAGPLYSLGILLLSIDSILPDFSANFVSSPQNCAFLFEARYLLRYAEVLVAVFTGFFRAGRGRTPPDWRAELKPCPACPPLFIAPYRWEKVFMPELKEPVLNIAIDGDGIPECMAVDFSAYVALLGRYWKAWWAFCGVWPSLLVLPSPMVVSLIELRPSRPEAAP